MKKMVLVDITTSEIQLLDLLFKECRLKLDAAEVAIGLRKKVYLAYKTEHDKKVKDYEKKIGKKD
jgi:hypothetical protein